MKRLIRSSLAVALTLTLASAGHAGLFGGHHKGKHKNSKETPTVGKRIPILLSEQSALPDPALANVPVAIPDAEVNPGWAQPGGTPSKANGNYALGAAIRPVWTKHIFGNTYRERLTSAPVVAGGKLFVMDTHAKVFCFNAQSGAQLWVADFGAFEGKFVVYGGGVSVDGDMVFATNGMGDVGALSATTGKLLWKKRPAGPLRGAPSIGYGEIFVTTQDNQMFALKAADGSIDWTASGSLESAGVFGAAAPAVAQGTVVQG
ncbi:MAG: PQQ-binding-like beta-propeller repeat protein, partial [Alphaproteobacteria bacterium]|nr:PQQ-binding-like beta-propeller repeat protein [Alphaproteobacteria bacterium]